MNFEIKSMAGRAIWSGDAESLRGALEKANLENANLENADIENANLENANLENANLRNANLRNANLRNADLENANLRNANLRNANFRNADLENADIENANLENADLRNADLENANLRNANLRNANFRNANLEPIRADLYAVLASSVAEVPALLSALREGRIDGSHYEGECACLVGTIANARNVNYALLSPDYDRASERWFLAIRQGDTPANNVVSHLTVEWIDAWLKEREASK